MFKKSYLILSLLSLAFALDAMQQQQEQPKQKPNFVFLDMIAEDSPDEVVTQFNLATIVTDSDLNIRHALRDGILFYHTDVDEYLPNLFSLITIQENPEFIRNVRELNPDLQGLENSIIKALMMLKQSQTATQLPSPLLVKGENMRKRNVSDFIRRFMPNANQQINATKIYDVDSIRTAVKLWNPTCSFERSPSNNPFDNAHILLEELKFYRTHYFKYPLSDLDDDSQPCCFTHDSEETCYFTQK